MYYRLFGDRIAVDTGPDLILTVGGMAGLIAFGIGSSVMERDTNRMRDIANEIAFSGGSPASCPSAMGF